MGKEGQRAAVGEDAVGKGEGIGRPRKRGAPTCYGAAEPSCAGGADVRSGLQGNSEGKVEARKFNLETRLGLAQDSESRKLGAHHHHCAQPRVSPFASLNE